MPGAEIEQDALFADILQSEVLPYWKGLSDKPEETPQNTLRALWFLAAGSPCSVEATQGPPLPGLSAAGRERLQELVTRRMQGTPLAHLTGRVSFMGIEMQAGPQALIPRKETETLGRAALEALDRIISERGFAVVVDLCTGSGNLALALAYHQPACEVYGSDLSQEAVALAEKNAYWLKLNHKVSFRYGDLLEPFDNEQFLGKVDLLVCNPPYISSARVPAMAEEIAAYEPSLAFDGGPFGLSVVFRLIREAPRFLRPGSWLCFEVGAGQGPALLTRLERSGDYRSVTACNVGGEIRALVAVTH